MITGSSSGVGDPVRLHPADAAGRPVDEGLAARRIRSTGSISRTKFGMQPLHHGLDDLLGDLGEDGFLGVEVAVEGALGDTGRVILPYPHQRGRHR